MGKGDWDVLRGDISNLLSAPVGIFAVISRRHSPQDERVLVYGISMARASPFWSGQGREGQVLEEEQVRREPAPQFPLEGVYRPRTDGAPVDRLEDGGLEIQVTIEDYEPRRNWCAGKFTLESSSGQ